jgi:hypothetical protein
MKSGSSTLLGLAVSWLVMTAGHAAADPGDAEGWKLDPLSYAIGSFSSFAEIVEIGLKKMALSQALPAGEMDRLEHEVRAIAEEWDVRIYREPDFLVTDLFPASATSGKEVLLIYRGDTLDEYMALKSRKAAMVADGSYDEAARTELAWAMGKLLSYPDEKIERLLAE